jgi:CheY-like chemotaxis protein
MLTDTDRQNARILIVDDQAAHVHLLERALQDEGYVNLSSTADPLQVVARHRAHRYDLILLDLQMPVLDGFGVMLALRADAGEGVLPVIALTAQPGHKLKALQAGAWDFISKPFDLVEIGLRIRHMLELRLLHQALQDHNQALERLVHERTAALQDSESRYRSFTELAADWYWEQDDTGAFIRGHGPVLEMLDPRSAADKAQWDTPGCRALRQKVAARQPFLDFVLDHQRADGSAQQFRISGEPMFDKSCRICGFRGVGTEVPLGRPND